MSDADLGSLAVGVLLLVIGANVLGRIFVRLRQPKVVGEIVAGVLLGPSLLGHFAPGPTASIFGRGATDPRVIGLGLLYDVGLLLLMFMSGSAVRHVLAPENRRATALILGLGAGIPFAVVLVASPLLPVESLAGPSGNRTAVMLVVAVAASVCSIPVISKIFFDLGILHTRFASLLLGAAVLEDIALWGVVAVALAVADAGDTAGADLLLRIGGHVIANAGFLVLAMTVMPRVLRRLSSAQWNAVARTSPAAWMLIVLLAYVAVAAKLEVPLAFAAFLAGFGIVGGVHGVDRRQYAAPLAAMNQVAGAVFIPLYFALVGFRLDFTKSFDPALLALFLVASSVVRIASVTLACRLSGFRGRALVNLAVTANARGGPGIVLASVAFDAGIINASFFASLVVTAVLTSQVCGVWLGHVIRSGRPLLEPVTTGDDELDPAALGLSLRLAEADYR